MRCFRRRAKGSPESFGVLGARAGLAPPWTTCDAPSFLPLSPRLGCLLPPTRGRAPLTAGLAAARPAQPLCRCWQPARPAHAFIFTCSTRLQAQSHHAHARAHAPRRMASSLVTKPPSPLSLAAKPKQTEESCRNSTFQGSWPGRPGDLPYLSRQNFHPTFPSATRCLHARDELSEYDLFLAGRPLGQPCR